MKRGKWHVIWWGGHPFRWRFYHYPHAWPRRYSIFRGWYFGLFEIRHVLQRELLPSGWYEEQARKEADTG